MATTTDEEFESQLDDELAWRRIELQSLASQLSQAARANADSPAARALSRGMATLLYAHWEGFAKATFDAYLKVVMKRKPLVTEAADGFLMTHVSHIVRRASSGDVDAESELLGLVRGGSTDRLRLPRGRVVDTKSNLRFVVLEELMRVFSLSMGDFTTKRNLIDVLLCDRRNDIAHGRANFPQVDEVLDLHKQVVSMMEDLRDQLIGSMRMKGYMA